MTLPPPPGAPFPDVGGRPLDPSIDPTDPWSQALRGRLFEERVVFVSGFLDDAAANRAAMELMTLDADGDERVRLHLDCSGAALGASFALMDVIDAMGVEVHALCVGQVAGTALGVLCVAQRRLATAHSHIRMCEPTFEVTGNPREIEAATRDQAARLRRLQERIADATGQPVGQIESDMRRGRYMAAEEAKAYGIVDEILRPEAKVLEFPRRFGFRRL